MAELKYQDWVPGTPITVSREGYWCQVIDGKERPLGPIIAATVLQLQKDGVSDKMIAEFY